MRLHTAAPNDRFMTAYGCNHAQFIVVLSTSPKHSHCLELRAGRPIQQRLVQSGPAITVLPSLSPLE
jgi:hypothetical protein